MHVAIVGAGALGRVYGVRLAKAKTGVTFVVRAARIANAAPMPIVRIDGDGAKDVLDAPELSAFVPAHADAVLVCVRAEQVNAELEAMLATREGVPIVVLTPLMPAAFSRLVRALGPRVLAAMPGVVAYTNDTGVTRYWLPRVAPTLIDEPRPPNVAVTELVRALVAGGIAARLELGVHETNPATTVVFIPFAMGLDVAGGVEALLRDRALLALTLDAAREGLALSCTIGKSIPWASIFTRFAGPRMIRIGVSLAEKRAPEAVRYVEEHFGHKLHAQNVGMAAAMLDLAREKGTEHEAIEGLLRRLRGEV